MQKILFIYVDVAFSYIMTGVATDNELNKQKLHVHEDCLMT